MSLVIGLFGACGGEVGRGESSCAMQFEFDGRTYTQIRRTDAFKAGVSLGSSTLHECDDVGGDGSEPGLPPEDVTVFRAVGFDPKVVLMGKTSSKDVLLFGALDGNGKLSTQAKDLWERAQGDKANRG